MATICTCTLNIKDFTGTAYDACELVAQPMHSSINGTNLILSKPVRAVPTAGLITINLTETATQSELVQFTLNWNNQQNYGSIIFDPITIPDQASLDLSTILSPVRG